MPELAAVYANAGYALMGTGQGRYKVVELLAAELCRPPEERRSMAKMTMDLERARVLIKKTGDGSASLADLLELARFGASLSRRGSNPYPSDNNNDPHNFAAYTVVVTVDPEKVQYLLDGLDFLRKQYELPEFGRLEVSYNTEMALQATARNSMSVLRSDPDALIICAYGLTAPLLTQLEDSYDDEGECSCGDGEACSCQHCHCHDDPDEAVVECGEFNDGAEKSEGFFGPDGPNGDE
jgi:hypothetical protein